MTIGRIRDKINLGYGALMITHTVLFRLNRPASGADRSLLVERLREFAEDPPYATGPAIVEESLLLRGESPRTADVLMTVTFPRAAAFPEYVSSPGHVQLLQETLEPMCEGWWSVQFES
jgi:hypothetical protein